MQELLHLRPYSGVAFHIGPNCMRQTTAKLDMIHTRTYLFPLHLKLVEKLATGSRSRHLCGNHAARLAADFVLRPTIGSADP